MFSGPPYPPDQGYPGGPAPPAYGFGYPPQQGGYPQQQGYPPQQGYPQQSYPPMGGYQAPPPPPPGYIPPGHYNSPYNANVHMDPEVGIGGAADEPKEYTLSFTDKSIRQSFIRKVFAILCVQLAVVAGLIAAFVFQ